MSFATTTSNGQLSSSTTVLLAAANVPSWHSMNAGSSIAGRYRVEAPLGRGGMAAVFQVIDERTGARVALKRMTKPENPAQLEKITTLFEREFYALSQLKHPHIVKVLDYGHDEDTPYYTMELLDGEDLNDLAPMPWQGVCEIMRSVCSALAVLHSRRQVHRDISPRNVRRTTSGLAKVIDFGAMAPMGQPSQIVGTPAFMAPEVVNAQSLDGRTDLYALGALAYWLLTGSAAYPARAIGQLRELWRSVPLPVATRRPEVPEALSQLVMSLLSLDPMARPVAAAEVMQRVCTIAGLPEEQAEAANAYLITPHLVGRNDTQLAFRKRTLRAKQEHGSATMLEGISGLGRSRLLASLALEAKMLGALVLRVNAAAAVEDGKPVLAALADEMLATARDLALETASPHAALLGLIAPRLYAELTEPEALATFDDPHERDSRVQDAFVDWFKSLPPRQVVAIYVDDVHRADELSLGVLSQLAQITEGRPLLIVTTSLVGTQHTARGLSRLRSYCNREALRPLRHADIDDLLRSVFGDVQGIRAAGEWIYRLGRGSPQSSMQLAQHLVDKKIAGYSQGSWTLPESLSGLDLPDSFEQTLEVQIAGLSIPALEVARALALTAGSSQLAMSSIVTLLRDWFGIDAVYQAIEELSGSGIATITGKLLEVRETATKQAIIRRLPEGERMALHRELAALYRKEETPRQFVVAYHLHAASDFELAYATFAAAIVDIWRAHDQDLFRSALGISLVEWALLFAKSSNASPRELYTWRRQLLLLAAVSDAQLARYSGETLDALHRDTGLHEYAQLDPQLDAGARLGICFERAMRAHAAAKDAEKGFDPFSALRELAMSCMSLSAVYAITWDCEGLRKIERLLAPTSGLSPGLQLLSSSLRITIETIVMGNGVVVKRRELLQSVERPIEGVEEPTRVATRFTHLFYLALEEAAAGDTVALDHADELLEQARYASLGWQARMVHFLCQGDAEKANECRQNRELVAAQNGDSDHDLIISMLYEVAAYAELGDLLGVARVLPRFERRARIYPGWRPWSYYASALYRSICGEQKRCLQDLEHALAEAGPGEHAAWQHAIVLYIETLVRCGEGTRALSVATDAKQAIDRLELRIVNPTPFDLAMALALHATGNSEQALELVERRLEKDLERGAPGVTLGKVHEALARMAADRGDHLEVQRHLSRVATLYKPGRHPGLLSRYERVLAETARRVVLPDGMPSSSASQDSPQRNFAAGSSVTTIARGWLMSMQNEQQRGREIVDALVRSSSATGGFLYSVDTAQDVILVARSDDATPELGMDRWVADYVRELAEWSSMDGSGTATASVTADAPSADSTTPGGGYLQRFGLFSESEGKYKVVAIIVLCSRDGAPLRVNGELLRAAADVLAESTGNGPLVTRVADDRRPSS